MCEIRWANKTKVVKKGPKVGMFGGSFYGEFVTTERVLQWKNSDGEWVDVNTEDVVEETTDES